MLARGELVDPEDISLLLLLFHLLARELLFWVRCAEASACRPSVELIASRFTGANGNIQAGPAAAFFFFF